MTTQMKSGFQGVTQLRTTLHGKLRDAEYKAQLIEYRREAVGYMPNPVDFEAVLAEYNIQGEREIDFLLGIASQPGARQIFLETVLQSILFRRGSEPIDIGMLRLAYEDVCRDMQQNPAGSTNGAPSTLHKGWVLLNVFKRGSKEFERGMGCSEGGIHHGR